METKWEIIQVIKTQPQSYRQVRNADLSDADLRGAFLRGAFLREADLREADLRGADLWGADLRGADLRGADLWEAVVLNADFGEGTGLSQKEKQDLARQGAIFGDASGDRESAYSPVR